MKSATVPEPAAAPPAPERLSGSDQEFRLVEIDRIRPSKTNPRKTFDPEALEKLAASIRETGIHEPLIVRPYPGDVDYDFEIVAGERRYRAAKLAGLETVPAMVRELTDEQAMEIQLIENLQREDVHPLEEGEGYRRLLASGKYSVKTLAQKIGRDGMSDSYVYARLKLADLIEPAKKAFLAGKIEEGHAVLIARRSPKDQADALKACLVENDAWDDKIGPDYERQVKPDKERTASVRELRRWLREFLDLDLAEAPFALDNEKILPDAGACTACPKREVEGKKSHCGDRACFSKKYLHWIARARGSAVAIVSDLTTDELGRLGIGGEALRKETGLPIEICEAGTWHKVTPKCPEDVEAFVAHGQAKGRILRVCTSEKCKAAREDARPKDSGPKLSAKEEAAMKAARAREKAQETKRRNETEVRRRLFDCIRSSAKDLKREDLVLIAVAFFKDVWFERRKFIAKVHGWDVHDDIESQVEKLSDRELKVFILEIALSGSIHVSPHCSLSEGRETLDLAAARHGVSVGGVEKALEIAREEAQANKKRGRG